MANVKCNSYKYKDWTCFEIFCVFYLVGESVGRWFKCRWLVVFGKVEDLLVVQVLVVGDRWVDGGPVGGSVGRLKTCR